MSARIFLTVSVLCVTLSACGFGLGVSAESNEWHATRAGDGVTTLDIGGAPPSLTVSPSTGDFSATMSTTRWVGSGSPPALPPSLAFDRVGDTLALDWAGSDEGLVFEDLQVAMPRDRLLRADVRADAVTLADLGSIDLRTTGRVDLEGPTGSLLIDAGGQILGTAHGVVDLRSDAMIGVRCSGDVRIDSGQNVQLTYEGGDGPLSIIAEGFVDLSLAPGTYTLSLTTAVNADVDVGGVAFTSDGSGTFDLDVGGGGTRVEVVTNGPISVRDAHPGASPE